MSLFHKVLKLASLLSYLTFMGQLVTLPTVVMGHFINVLSMVMGGVLLITVVRINATWTLRGAQPYMVKAPQYSHYLVSVNTL